MYGATVQGAGNITVSGTGSAIDWYDGTITGSGQLIIASSGTLSVTNNTDKKGDGPVGRVLDRALLNSGTVTLDDNKMGIAVTANGAITNESGGTFNFEVADGLAASGTAGHVHQPGNHHRHSRRRRRPRPGGPGHEHRHRQRAVGHLGSDRGLHQPGNGDDREWCDALDRPAAAYHAVGRHDDRHRNRKAQLQPDGDSHGGNPFRERGPSRPTFPTRATVTPGSSSSPGTLTISGNYTQTSAGTLSVDVAGTTAGSGYGQLVVTGSVSLAGALTLAINYSNHAGDAYEIINDQATSAESGTFSGLPEGGTFTLGPAVYGVTYRGGTGNDFVVTTVSLARHVGRRNDAATGTRPAIGARGPSRPAATMSSSAPGDTVTISSGAISVANLSLAGDAARLQSGTSLSLASASTVSGTLDLDGGTLRRGGKRHGQRHAELV